MRSLAEYRRLNERSGRKQEKGRSNCVSTLDGGGGENHTIVQSKGFICLLDASSFKKGQKTNDHRKKTFDSKSPLKE